MKTMSADNDSGAVVEVIDSIVSQKYAKIPGFSHRRDKEYGLFRWNSRVFNPVYKTV